MSKELAVLTKEFNLDMNKIIEKLFNDLSCKHPKPTEPTALKLFNDRNQAHRDLKKKLSSSEKTRTVAKKRQKTVKSSYLPTNEEVIAFVSDIQDPSDIGVINEIFILYFVWHTKDIYAGNDRPHYQCKLFTCEEDAEGGRLFPTREMPKYECAISKKVDLSSLGSKDITPNEVLLLATPFHSRHEEVDLRVLHEFDGIKAFRTEAAVKDYYDSLFVATANCTFKSFLVLNVSVEEKMKFKINHSYFL
jgi:hypothetical protein